MQSLKIYILSPCWGSAFRFIIVVGSGGCINQTHHELIRVPMFFLYFYFIYIDLHFPQIIIKFIYFI